MSYKEHLERRLRELGTPNPLKCSLNPGVPLVECRGHFEEIGTEHMEHSVEKPLGMCRYCYMMYPLDNFREEE